MSVLFIKIIKEFLVNYFFLKDYKKTNNRELLIEGYAYSMLFDSYDNDGSTLNRRIFKRKIKDIGTEELNSKEKSSARTIYKKLVKKANFTTYIDEARDAWDTPLDGY